MYNLIRLKYENQDAQDRNNHPAQPLIPVAAHDEVQQNPYGLAPAQNNAQVPDLAVQNLAGQAPAQNIGNPQVAAQQPDPDINVQALVLTILLYIIPITCIVYGIIHLRDCPAQNMIDYSIIILGGLSFVARFLNCPYECRSICRRGNDFPRNKCLIWLNVILQFGIIAVFISLCYYIFTIDPATKPDESNLPNYCELQFYRNTYWGCVVGLALVGLMFLALFCFCCLICIIACIGET